MPIKVYKSTKQFVNTLFGRVRSVGPKRIDEGKMGSCLIQTAKDFGFELSIVDNAHAFEMPEGIRGMKAEDRFRKFLCEEYRLHGKRGFSPATMMGCIEQAAMRAYVKFDVFERGTTGRVTPSVKRYNLYYAGESAEFSSNLVRYHKNIYEWLSARLANRSEPLMSDEIDQLLDRAAAVAEVGIHTIPQRLADNDDTLEGPFGTFVGLLKGLMQTCRAFGMARDSGTEVLAAEIRRVCDENDLDVCVTTRGYTATEPPAAMGLDGVPTAAVKFCESVSEALGGQVTVAKVREIIDNACIETGLEMWHAGSAPKVTVTKTEAGNTVISERKPATGGAIAETVVHTDAFKEAVERLVAANIIDMLQSSSDFEHAVNRVLKTGNAYDTAEFNTAITRNVKDDLDRDGIIAHAIANSIRRGGTLAKALADRFEGRSRCD